MAVNVLDRRQLYVDVVTKEEGLEEIFLYQVDFLKDRSFRTKEYLFVKEEAEEKTAGTEEETVEEENTEPMDIKELFKEQWELLLETEVPVDVFATDAGMVLSELFFELLKKYPEMPLSAPKNGKKEVLHDFISMGRVTSVSTFDEEQYLSATIRRRMKEKYHERAEEVKKERAEHIFLRRMSSGSPYELELFVTDSAYRIQKNMLLPKVSNEETLTLRLAEILEQHPEADLIVDKVSVELFRMLDHMTSFVSMGTIPAVFSLESMFFAVGKVIPTKELVENYVQYIKNIEEMRFGRFVSEEIHSVHTFYVPVRLSGEKDWKLQFKNNTVWKPDGADCYDIKMEEQVKGKYVIKAGKEQFVLKLRRVSLKKYLRDYAVLCMETENHCYPGKMDRERINVLASYLFASEEQGPDSMEIKLKAGGQAYSLTTVKAEGNEDELWLNGLLALGRRKKSKNHALTLHAVCNKMYCRETEDAGREEEIVRVALLKSGVLKEIETKMAVCTVPEKKNAFGSLSGKQSKQMRLLYGMYRFLMVSFGQEYQNGKEAERRVYADVEQTTGIQEAAGRLKEKFGLFLS